MADKNNPLVLTASNRLARWLMLDYDDRQKQKKVWETSQILPLSAWLKQVWLDTWPEKHLFSRLQSESLWEKIINSDSNSTKLSLLHRKAAASQAYQAYTLVHEYKLPRFKSDYQETLETISFYKWMQIYQNQLLQWNALDAVEIIDQVSELISAERIELPSTITFEGFEKKSPQLQRLLDAMERKGVKTKLDFSDQFDFSDKTSLTEENTHTSVQKFDDKIQEAITCARWIRKLSQPGKRFGVIVPELENYRSLLQREFAAELSPASIFPDNKSELPFNISQGSPLNQTTPINLIFQILETPSCDIPAEIFYSIIRTTIFHSNKSAALAMEQTLRNKRLVTINLNKLETQFNFENSSELYKFVVAWKNWVLIKQFDLPSHWSTKIYLLLQEMNWPEKNEGKITQKENQVFESWKNCLDQLASLNHIVGKIHRLAAVNKLFSIAQNFLFPEKNRDHLIQVIQLSECPGMRFDHTWIMGCHSEGLPPSPEPNSLIPSAFRRKFNLPRSNAKWELENSEQHLAAVLNSSKDIVFSYPSQEKDNTQEPSPLIKHFPLDDSFVLPSARYKDQICNAAKPEPFEETPILPFTENEIYRFKEGKKSGGASLLKNQSDCPFRAFARYRLHAQKSEIPDTDFDPLVRGNLIHLILELFWKKTQTRVQLEKLFQSNQLEIEVQNCVEEATSVICQSLVDQPEFLKMEKNRNQSLALEWLINFELARNDFTVLKPEKSETAKINGLTLNLKIDRIDEISDKKHVLIDYKSGEAKPGDWLKERIIAPQLPLYSTLITPSVVAFGKIKKGQIEFKGVKDSSIDFSGFKATNYTKETKVSEWNDLLELWKSKIEFLANEFLSGRAVIEPALNKETCKNCDLDSLCRIRERDSENEEEEK
ncbi:MAG: ATP-dependent helicase/nuclease subunit B [Nitrospinales bacterium]|jgi:ATP-dependent helicase/nuclease subunit B